MVVSRGQPPNRLTVAPRRAKAILFFQTLGTPVALITTSAPRSLVNSYITWAVFFTCL